MPSSRTRLDAGKRDRLVTIQERSVVDAVDEVSGEPLDNDDDQWTTLVDAMPAAKEELSGNERFRQDRVAAHYDQRWVINYRVDMDPELVDVPKLRRLSVNGRVLEIVYAAEIGRRAGIELLTLASTQR